MRPEAPLDPCEVLARAYDSVREETDRELEIVEGAFPAALAGTYYRNGPGRMSFGGQRYGHPFDGDGMVVRLAIEAGRVRYRNRYVRTRELLDEERAGRIMHRGFGTLRPGGIAANLLRGRTKNAANSSVVAHAGALHALFEGGWPHRLDPITLATIGRDDLGGALVPDTPLARALGIEWPFAAHPKFDPRTGELWGFGAVPGRRPRIAIHRFDRHGVLIERRLIEAPRASFVHDMVLTERWAVLIVPPVVLDVTRAALGWTTPARALRRDPAATTTVLVVPREGGSVRTIEARSFFSFHHLNGWDEGRAIVIDTLRMDQLELGDLDVLDPSSIRRARPGRTVPTRLTIDLARGRVEEDPRIELDAELPTIDPRRRGRPSRFAWAIARPAGFRLLPFPALARLDLDRRRAVVRDLSPDLPGEPLFVPRPGGEDEDDGWLLSLVYRARSHRSELWVLDARDLMTIARAALPHHVPPGSHGTFVAKGSLDAKDQRSARR